MAELVEAKVVALDKLGQRELSHYSKTTAEIPYTQATTEPCVIIPPAARKRDIWPDW